MPFPKICVPLKIKEGFGCATEKNLGKNGVKVFKTKVELRATTKERDASETPNNLRMVHLYA